MIGEQERLALTKAKRVVVKVGTRVLTQKSGRPETRRIKSLVQEISKLHSKGVEVVFVTSGAIGAGIESLNLKKRPSDLPGLQTAAAVGQVRLMAQYDQLFSKKGCQVGQVLLTQDDFKNRQRYLNARNTILSMLRNRIIPIINENDVISVDEIKVGDNDFLAAMVALKIEADALVLLTATNGLRAPTSGSRTKRISYLKKVTKEELSLAVGKTDALSTGGMATKLEAASMAVKGGLFSIIADGKNPKALENIFNGKDEGTLIGTISKNGNGFSAKKKWIAFSHKHQGTVTIDKGACEAIQKKHKSLLPVGLKKIAGTFPQGSLISIQNSRGEEIARGLSPYSSQELDKIKGKKLSDVAKILGSEAYQEVVHRDNMLIL